MNINDFIKNFPSEKDIPEKLIKLFNYQESINSDYSGHFYLYDKYWELPTFPPFDNKKLMSHFVFFGRDADGSIYSFWSHNNQPLSESPIVFISSEWVGNSALANSFDEFLVLLSLGIDELGYSVSSPDWFNNISNDPPTIAFRKWLRDELNINLSLNPLEIFESTKRNNPDFEMWLDENS